jgi:hypothetical protein
MPPLFKGYGYQKTPVEKKKIKMVLKQILKKINNSLIFLSALT